MLASSSRKASGSSVYVSPCTWSIIEKCAETKFHSPVRASSLLKIMSLMWKISFAIQYMT